ncbi:MULTISPECIES: AAA family ATPase [Planktothrix]|uniref:AAA family ATPase n=1 Tax=Planktothrix TaxID=54304 RepID=UPI0008FEDBFC|nr:MULTISPECIES: AAA family ATPase [Planktothrix]
MDSIRVERLRCLSDTGDIKIKPLTVLLGQNSSGKSSFLRVFPLLKQSIESRTTGPILWSGRLVDFGNFNDAHKRNADNNIAFSFKFQLKFSENSLINIYLTIQVSEDEEKQTTRTSKIALRFEDSEIELEFDENECVTIFSVNSLDILSFGYQYMSQKFDTRSLLPIIMEEIDKNKDNEIEKTLPLLMFARSATFSGLFKTLTKQTKKYRPSKSEHTIRSGVYGFLRCLGNSENMLKYIQQESFNTKSWKNKTSKWTIETEEFQQLRDLIIALEIPFILKACDNTITDFSRQISYMGPIRATAERYYRTQDLAVDEVDYQGKNLAMFLRNLTDEERKNFSEWTLEQFGFEPSIISSLGHISLMIKHNNSDRDLNIADTGFGFSQILPIITQLWLLSVFPKFQTKSASHSVNERIVTYAIEQPELHLHPRLQGTLTDTFVAAINTARNNDIDLRLVIETHSEVLVNRLGHLVAEKKISPDDINIVLFEPSEESGEIQVRTSQFDAEGYLENWPLGFFEMELV